MEPHTEVGVLEVEWGGATFFSRKEGSLLYPAPRISSWREPLGVLGARLLTRDLFHPGEKWMGPVPPGVNARL